MLLLGIRTNAVLRTTQDKCSQFLVIYSEFQVILILVKHMAKLVFSAPALFWPGQSGEARIFLIQDDNLTAEVPLRRSILQSTLRQKYRSTGRHNPQRDGGPEKGLYRLHPIALLGPSCSPTREPGCTSSEVC